jgi:HAMP domain-containing protein
MDAGVLVSLIVAIIGVAITVVIWLASTRAVRPQSNILRSVDEDAYERARKIYEGAIDQLETEVVRLNTQVRELQSETIKLNGELARLRGLGHHSGDTPPDPMPAVS